MIRRTFLKRVMHITASSMIVSLEASAQYIPFAFWQKKAGSAGAWLSQFIIQAAAASDNTTGARSSSVKLSVATTADPTSPVVSATQNIMAVAGAPDFSSTEVRSAVTLMTVAGAPDPTATTVRSTALLKVVCGAGYFPSNVTRSTNTLILVAAKV